MFKNIQPFLQRITRKQVGAGVAGFAVGVGLTLYLERRGPIEAVIEPGEAPDNVRYLRDVQLHETALVEDSLSEEYSVNVVEEHPAFQNPVVSPPQNDPKLIAVDLEALRRRDELIEIHGFTEGMRLYREEYSVDTEDDEPQVINVFAGEEDNWDQNEEEKSRNPEQPYVLHKDEFWREELGYTQTTLTYYEGDNMLVDQEDVPVYNFESIIGPLRFGHGSQDRNVFYVRNNRLRAEYEIIKDRGHYAIEILGLEEEEKANRSSLKHSLGKFRSDD